MLYRIDHTTSYHYTEPVTLCHNEAHLLPRHLTRQRCLDAYLRIDPTPAVYHERKDFFGNRVVYFSIEELHSQLTVTAVSEVQLSTLSPPDMAQTPPWEQVRRFVRQETSRGALEARQFVLDSPLVAASGPWAEYASEVFSAGRPLLLATQELMRRIYREFTYDSAFTTIATPLREVFEHKRGVCQDFAHLAIACIRSCGLAARYVSGYLETVPPEGQPQLVGTAASHAWVSVYCPELGWVDFDPTNDLMPTDRHIIVAWGRDYSDVPPLKGTLQGGGEHELHVAVEVKSSVAEEFPS